MNWRFLFSIVIALVARKVALAKLGWAYHPFKDAFDLLLFGRDAVLLLLLFGISLAIINAILGSREEN